MQKVRTIAAAHRDTVRLYKTSVERIQRLVGVDREVAHKEAERLNTEAERLRLAWIDAENALSNHRHHDVADNAKLLRRAG